MENNKSYYQRNRTKILKQMKEKYRINGPRPYAQCKDVMLKYRKSLKGRFNGACARNKDIWHLSFAVWKRIVENPCHYCGGKLSEQGSGLDRKKPSGGYTEDNVVPCCKVCNTVKNKLLTYEEMVVAMKAVQHFKQGNHTKEEHDQDTSKGGK